MGKYYRSLCSNMTDLHSSGTSNRAELKDLLKPFILAENGFF